MLPLSNNNLYLESNKNDCISPGKKSAIFLHTCHPFAFSLHCMSEKQKYGEFGILHRSVTSTKQPNRRFIQLLNKQIFQFWVKPILNKWREKSNKMNNLRNIFFLFIVHFCQKDNLRHPKRQLALIYKDTYWKSVFFPSATWMEITIKSFFGILMAEWHQQWPRKTFILERSYGLLL